MAEFMKVPGVLGDSPTGRRNGTGVSDAGNTSRMKAAEDRASAAMPGRRQANATARLKEQNTRAANNRMGTLSKPKGAPQKNLDGTPAIPGVQKPMHSAVGANTRQFGSVGGAMKGALSRVRTASRLKGLLRRGR